jgi:hypothetical protein
MVYPLPEDVNNEFARLKRQTMVFIIDKLTKEQTENQSSQKSGTLKKGQSFALLIQRGRFSFEKPT